VTLFTLIRQVREEEEDLPAAVTTSPPDVGGTASVVFFRMDVAIQRAAWPVGVQRSFWDKSLRV